MKGANIRTSVRITFEEAVFGVEKELDLNLRIPARPVMEQVQSREPHQKRVIAVAGAVRL